MVLFENAAGALRFTVHNFTAKPIQYDFSSLGCDGGAGTVAPDGAATVECARGASDMCLVSNKSHHLLTLPYEYGRPVFFRFGCAGAFQTIDIVEMPGFDILFNDEDCDQMRELGYEIKLTRGTTSNIQIEIRNYQ